MSTISNSVRLLGGIADAFGDRNFCIYSIGAVASWTSFFVQLIAVAWLTWELTGSTAWLAAMGLLDILPGLVLMPLAGVLADRVDRFRLIVRLYAVLLVQAGVLAAMAWASVLTIWRLCGLVLIHSILIAFAVPCMYAMLPRFVCKTRLASAIAVNSSYTQLSLFVGPAFAGWIISAHGVGAAFAVNALGYAVYLVSVVFLKTPGDYRHPEPSEHSVLVHMKEGVTAITHHPGLLALVVMLFAGDALGMALVHMLPAYSETILGMGVAGVSLILSARGAGAAASALWMAHGGTRVVRFERIVWGFCIGAVAMTLLFAGSVAVAVAAAVVLGVANEIRKTGTLSLIQMTINEERRGRVMGNMYMVHLFAAAIGTYLIGVAAVDHGLAAPMMALAALCLAIGAVYALRRKTLAQAFRPNQ